MITDKKLEPILQSQPWWELGDGWCVHLGLDQFFCQAWNKRTGELATWSALIPQLYQETIHDDWLRLVSDAIAHGKRSPSAF